MGRIRGVCARGLSWGPRDQGSVRSRCFRWGKAAVAASKKAMTAEGQNVVMRNRLPLKSALAHHNPCMGFRTGHP